MKRNLKQIARDITTLSPLMNGREKIETATLIKKYPNGIHIFGMDLAPNPKGEPYAVVCFREDELKYYCGGLILTKIVNALLAECDGDFDVLNGELVKEPLGVKLEEKKTSDGKNNLTTVEIID